MQKYLLLYRTPTSDAPTPPPSPEQMQAMMAAWGAWKAQFKDQVTDLGDGLKPGGRVLAGGLVTDGAFIESKEVIGGYSIVTAGGYDEAVAVAKACPINQMPGARVEIRELAGL